MQGVLLIVGTVGMKILIAKLINVADDVRADNSISTHAVGWNFFFYNDFFELVTSTVSLNLNLFKKKEENRKSKINISYFL